MKSNNYPHYKADLGRTFVLFVVNETCIRNIYLNFLKDVHEFKYVTKNGKVTCLNFVHVYFLMYTQF